jgi:hypothetical protein
MVTVRMVQTTVYEVVDMVTMRHRFMSAVWTVRVRATDLRRALHRICGGDPDGMLVHVILVHMVEMAIVEIIHMAFMPNRGVPAIRAMLVRVAGVMFLCACGHEYSLRARFRSIPIIAANSGIVAEATMQSAHPMVDSRT